MVGQHFAHVDNAVFFFQPKAGIAGTDFAVDGGSFDVFSFLTQRGGNPFAKSNGGNDENQTELRQNQQQLFGTHATGFDNGQLAAGSQLAQGNQAADQNGKRHQFICARRHLH